MPTSADDSLHTLRDFIGFLSGLQDQGLEYSVIGGMAVGAYAALINQESMSRDLDIVTTGETLNAALDWAAAQGMAIRKRPQPRTIPVAFLEWEGHEINILTGSLGLPEPEAVFRAARYFHLQPELAVPVADPFDLLRNKLRVNRPKDQPHIAILLDFVTEEAITAFERETDPRKRLAPARELLRVTGAPLLTPELAAALLERASTRADYNFLVMKSPSAEPVLARAPEKWQADLQGLLKHRA